MLLVIRNGAFAAAIAAALIFGAAEALSGPPGLSWRPDNLAAPADTLCQLPDPCVDDPDCEIGQGICEPPTYWGGTCEYDRARGYKCCLCFE